MTSLTARILVVAALSHAAEFRAGVAGGVLAGVPGAVPANAVAVEDRKGSAVLFISTGPVALPRSVIDVIAANLQKNNGLDRSRVLFSSHMDAAPVVPSGRIAAERPDEQKRVVMEYHSTLARQLSELAGAALQNLTPVEIDFGTTGVAATVLRLSRSGKDVALIVSGGIDGHAFDTAKSTIKQQFPESAVVLLATAAPPDGEPTALADRIRRLAVSKLQRIAGSIRAAFSLRDLPPLEPFAKPAAYPVQAIRFGNKLTLLALAGEVSPKLALRIRSEYRKEQLMITAHSNETPDTVSLSVTDEVEERIVAAIHDVLRRVGVRRR